MDDEDYKKLAQLCAIIQTEFADKKSTLDAFLQENKHIVNCQIPENNYFKLNNPDLIGCTPLHFVFKRRELETFKQLLNFGADISIKNANGETVFYQAFKEFLTDPEIWKWKRASETSFADLMLSALINTSNSANPSNNDGISHFHIACLANNTKAIELFLKAGASINQAVNFNVPILPGYTPLHFAARYFSIESMEMLLKNGADVHLKDAKGMSSLHMLINHNMELVNLSYASSRGSESYEDIDVLEHSECRSEQKVTEFKFIDFEGSSNTFLKKFELNKKMILLLLDWKNNYDRNVIDSIDLSNFHVACCHQDISIVKTFYRKSTNLEHSINGDSPIWPGYTALHFAAQFDIETVKLLLLKGANIIAKDAKGITPFDLCLRKYDFGEICSIIDSQSNWKNIYFSDGKTKLLDFIFSMKEISSFDAFLRNIDVNISITHDSALWPGYTPLHLTIAVCKTIEVFNIFENSNDNFYGKKISKLKKDYVQRIKKCLDLGADVTTKNARGWTPIHLAFYENKLSFADLLLENYDNNVNPVDENGLSHLHIACILKKHVERFTTKSNIDSSVKCSLAADAVSSDYHSGYQRGWYIKAGFTPLHVIVSNGDHTDGRTMSMIKKLIENGADVHSKDVDGLTPLHRIFMRLQYISSKRELMKIFLSTDLKNYTANCGLSDLHILSVTDNVAAVERAIDLGADINGTLTYKNPTDGDDIKDNVQKLIRHYAGYTPLDFALNEMCNKVTSVLLRRGANVLISKPNGSVLLKKFFINSSMQRKKLFFQEYKNNEKMQEHIEKETGLTMLHMACAALDFDVILNLLNRNSEMEVNATARANSPVWPSCTPLHILAMEGKRTIHGERKSVGEIIELMIVKGANIFIQNEQLKTPLHELVDRVLFYNDKFATNPEIDLISKMLKGHKQYTVNPINARGISHFHIACMCNNAAIVKNYIEHGVDVNQAVDYFVDGFGGCTPLHLAVARKSRETAILLLRHNANASAENLIGETPIQTILFRNGFEIEDLDPLIKAGADVNHKNMFGETPLESLIRLFENRQVLTIDDEAIIKTAVKFQCRINVFWSSRGTGFIGRNIRNSSIWNTEQNPNKNDTVERLIEAIIQSPDVNYVDSLGRNVIHNIVSVDRSFEITSVENEYVVAIDKLVKSGFDVDHQDERGFTPLHVAINFRNLDGITGLLNNGADLNIVDKKGRPAYAYHLQKFLVQDDDLTNLSVHVIIQRHIKKMEFFRIPVCAANQYLMAQRPNYIHEDNQADERHAQFMHEVDSVKSKKIDPYPLTLNDFLSETGAVSAYPYKNICESQAIDEFFRSNHGYLYKNFPELMGILYLQYRKAVVRKDLSESAATSLNILSGFDLPCLCSWLVFRYLTNDELNNLIASTNDE